MILLFKEKLLVPFPAERKFHKRELLKARHLLTYLQANKRVRQFIVQNLQCSRIINRTLHSESDSCSAIKEISLRVSKPSVHNISHLSLTEIDISSPQLVILLSLITDRGIVILFVAGQDC